MDCGREPGGAFVAELGTCPAAVDTLCDGINGGTNAGRVCWARTGTMCVGIVQGSFAQKQMNCSKCDFFMLVQQEESLSELELFKQGYRLLSA
jgi:hypothetical protein